MSSVTKTKYFATIAVVAVAACVGCTVSYVAGKSSGKVNQVYQYMLSESVNAGTDLSDKVVKVPVSSNQAIDSSETISSVDELDGMVAKTDMVKFQPITKDSFISKEVYKDDSGRNLDFAMPTSVEGTVANSLKPNDLVAIKVRYKDNSSKRDAVVVSCIPVSELRTSEGNPVSTSKGDSPDGSEGSIGGTNNNVPAFILFHVNNAESADLNMAKKEGTLYIVKYLDVSKEKLEKTYIYGKDPKISLKNGDNITQIDPSGTTETTPSTQATTASDSVNKTN